MIINLLYRKGGQVWPIKWNTDQNTLGAGGPSEGEYEFIGTDTLAGGLALTLHFRDVTEVDSFMDIAQAAYKDVDLTNDEVVRWGKFMDSLAALIGAAPKFGDSKVYDHPRSIAWDPYERRSYHAGIDAQRIPPREDA